MYFKNNSTLIDNAEDLDIVMPMYNILLEYKQNYININDLNINQKN